MGAAALPTPPPPPPARAVSLHARAVSLLLEWVFFTPSSKAQHSTAHRRGSGELSFITKGFFFFK